MFNHLIVETFTVGSFQLSASIDGTDFNSIITAVPAGPDPDWLPTLTQPLQNAYSQNHL
jgi:hypothetical protein